MARGGKRPGSGRPSGARNKRTKAVNAATDAAVAKIEAALLDPFEGDAHALLVSVYKDTSHDMPLRIDAAKAAIRYEKPALSTIDAKIEADVTAKVTTIRLKGPDD